MNRFLRNASALWAVLTVGLAALPLGGCGVEPDRLVAMGLSAAPTEEDWALALPLRLAATGGATSISGDSAVDKDSVHKATASCHHGSNAPPVKVEVRAFYTAERLYLRFTWTDPTPDLGPSWSVDAEGWLAKPLRRDGLGIIWGEAGKPFNCAMDCHLRDWRQAGARAFADYAMAAPGGAQDFWVWRAGRDRPEGSAEDCSMTSEGKRGDSQGEFEVPNSRRARVSGAVDEGAFTRADSPLSQERGAGGFLPGFLTSAKAKGSLEVEGTGSHRDGRWTLTLSRNLAGADPSDAAFAPGGERLFGLALLDGVVRDHNAVAKPVRLQLILPREARGGE